MRSVMSVLCLPFDSRFRCVVDEHVITDPYLFLPYRVARLLSFILAKGSWVIRISWLVCSSGSTSYLREYTW